MLTNPKQTYIIEHNKGNAQTMEVLKMKVKKLLKYYEGKYIIWQIDIVCTNDSTKKEYNKIKNKKVLFCQCDDSTLHIDIE